MKPLTLDVLRRYAVARTLFRPTTLAKAIARLGFIQADPIRAPARAQDLTLRHRVVGYRAGDLERRYPRLGIEEDFFVNYGFIPQTTQRLMHPRTARRVWSPERRAQAEAVLAFVRERGVVHPRDVDLRFAHGKSRNWFGGTSNDSTQLLDEMHYRGLVRTARRAGGIRLYAPGLEHEPVVDSEAASDALLDIATRLYAPLPQPMLGKLASQLVRGTPQWQMGRADAVRRARQRLASATVDGMTWLWPADENPASRRYAPDDAVRLLAPFDPIVWDRMRFERLWGWSYRFEAYTPAALRVRGYYALPMLWGDAVIGWGNLAVRDGRLDASFGYVRGRPPRSVAFRRSLEDELERMSVFLGLDRGSAGRAEFDSTPASR
jgi:uncharacterized protein YcaQ